MEKNEPTKFDPDGRDPALVEMFRWLAKCTGTPFDREAVPIGVTDGEWWRDFLAAIEADPRSSGAAMIERNARRPDYGMTSSQQWGLEQRRKKKFMEAVSGTSRALPSPHRERAGDSDG